MASKRYGADIMSFFSLLKVVRSGFLSHSGKNHIFLDENYAEGRLVRQRLDLVFPKNAKGSMGVVLCIHGGGWIEGKKESYTKDLFRVSEEHSVAAASMNYRFADENTGYDEMLDDISSALKYIRKKGEKYGLNFDRVLLTGISAGAHLSLLYSMTRKDTAPVKPVCVVELCGPVDLEHPFYFSEDNRCDVEFFRKIIGYGIKRKITPDNADGVRDALKKYSPINYVDEHTVPIAFGQGTVDDVVPYQNSVDLDRKLSEYNVKHTFISFPDSNHECEDEKSKKEIMHLFFEYIDTYLK